MTDYSITTLSEDSTRVIPCRAGDLLLWVQDKADMFDPNIRLDILDLWATNNGESVVITNRLEDVPEWLLIEPSRVGGRNVRLMASKLAEGFKLAQLRVSEMSGVWEIKVSDYLLWCGDKRGDCGYHNGVLAIFKVETGAVALLQNKVYDHSLSEGITSDDSSFFTDEKATQIRSALNFLGKQGKGRRYQNDWTLG